MRGAADRAREFAGLAARLDETRGRVRAQAASGGDDAAADLLNRTMLRLSRLLVPIASTAAGAYGQDRYGHAWQTQMIPSLVPYPALATYPRDSEAFQVWWVAMIRARNRVADALQEASELVRRALETLPAR
jgi:hypothetical protein